MTSFANQLFFVASLLLPTLPRGEAIECYKCSAKSTPTFVNQTVQVCAEFDGSARFRVDCPFSTLCMKRNFTMQFPGSAVAVVTERGCAQQVLSYKVRSANGQWNTVNDVDKNVYQEGCHEENAGLELDKPPTLYCYCSGRLCNSSPISERTSKVFLATAFLALLFKHGIVL